MAKLEHIMQKSLVEQKVPSHNDIFMEKKISLTLQNTQQNNKIGNYMVKIYWSLSGDSQLYFFPFKTKKQSWLIALNIFKYPFSKSSLIHLKNHQKLVWVSFSFAFFLKWLWTSITSTIHNFNNPQDQTSFGA